MKTTRRLRDSTIEGKVKRIKRLSKRANLWNIEEVKDAITLASWSNKYKELIEYSYKDWAEFQGFEYKPRKYYREKALPYVPPEKDIDQLIAGMNKKYAIFLQLLKETGCRCGEAVRLTPEDFDLERRIVTINKPEKRSRPRQLKISQKLVAMITPLILRTKPHNRIWSVKLKHIRKTFERSRNRTAEKLGNPRINRICFHTFRHWKATMEYHQTKDLLHVMRLLGHTNIQNTLVYTHLVNWENDDFVCKTAKTIEEATELIESGFEYVCDMDNVKLFRKRK